MRVKVCGTTLMRDLRLAEWAGAEFVGFVVEAPSPRAITREVAAMLARAARAKPVYVTVDMPVEELAVLVEKQRPAAVQLHGDEAPEYVRELGEAIGEGVEIWKAMAATDERSLSEACEAAAQFAEAGAKRILLDTRVGGRGEEKSAAFPIELAEKAVKEMPLPCIIAGGLTPEILPELWRQAKPWAVDLASSLEREPGRKDPARMMALANVIRGSA